MAASWVRLLTNPRTLLVAAVVGFLVLNSLNQNSPNSQTGQGSDQVLWAFSDNMDAAAPGSWNAKVQKDALASKSAAAVQNAPPATCPPCPTCSDKKALAANTASSSADLCGPVDIARPHRTESRSFHRCVNQWRGGGPSKVARCHFENVCMKRDGTLLYYVGDDEPPEFENPLLYLDKTYEQVINPKIVRGPLPSNAQWYAGIATHWASYVPGNFGHALDDDFFSMFRLLRLFRFHKDRDVLLVEKGEKSLDCDQREDGREPPCTHLHELAPFLASDIISVKKPPAKWNSGTPEQPLFCARHFLAGTHRLGMGWDIEGIHDEYIEHLLCRAGLDPTPPLPKQPRVAVFVKHGRRRTVNSEDIAKAIRNELHIEVDVLNVASIELKEQMATMAKYVAVISPAGGVSYTSAFLPPGASVILIGSWDSIKNESLPLDRFIFSTRGRTRDYYYLPDFDDLLVNSTSAYSVKIPKDQLYRDYVDIRVNTDKMVKLLNTALIEMGYRVKG